MTGDPMTPRDALAELRELSEKATPGPWKGNDTVIWREGDAALDAGIAANDPKAGPIIASDLNGGRSGSFAASTYGERSVRGANAALIVAAVNILRDPGYTLLSTEEYDRLRGIESAARRLMDVPDQYDAVAGLRAALEAQGGPK